jgi:hypothetical protein
VRLTTYAGPESHFGSPQDGHYARRMFAIRSADFVLTDPSNVWDFVLANLTSIIGLVSAGAAVFAVILAIRGINLSRATARDQRENRDFAHDRVCTDAFTRVIRAQRFELGNFESMAADETNALIEVTRRAILEAFREYMVGVSGDIHLLRPYVNSKINTIFEWPEIPEGEVLRDRDMSELIENRLRSLELVVQEWVYPERRSLVNKEIRRVAEEFDSRP